MTWFRCGGSGIPAALKSQMNAVFNKKFGTAVDYPAEGWPDDVNLMGPLPEGTATGPIVTFADGADDVPTKSLVVTIPPTLSGTSEVTETQIEGKDYLNGATVVQGGFNINNGNNYASTNRLRTNNYIPITSGSYTIENDQNYEYVVYVYDETDAFIDAESIKTWQTYGTAFSISGNRHIRIGWRKSDNSTITADEISGYHCYKVGTKTTYPASLGRTIYGGQVDIVNGTGKDKTLRYELDENDSWSAYSGASHSFWHNVATGEDRPIKQTEASESICNYASYSSASPTSAPDFSFLIQGGQRIVVTADSSIDTVDKFKTWLSSHNLVFVCPASTPTDFTFDGQEIPTRLGYNAFWSDSGDTEVTYRADISLALQAASGSRGLMMASRPAIGPANGDQGSEESTENNIEMEGDENAR